MRHANADAASEARDVSKGGPPRRRPVGSTYAAVSPSSRPWPIGSKVVMIASCRGCVVWCGGEWMRPVVWKAATLMLISSSCDPSYSSSLTLHTHSSTHPCPTRHLSPHPSTSSPPPSAPRPLHRHTHMHTTRTHPFGGVPHHSQANAWRLPSNAQPRARFEDGRALPRSPARCATSHDVGARCCWFESVLVSTLFNAHLRSFRSSGGAAVLSSNSTKLPSVKSHSSGI